MTALVDKHVVVTGSGSGVGAEIVKQFAANGAKVTILGRREAPLRQVADGVDAFYAVADVHRGGKCRYGCEQTVCSHAA